jgi:hypothetical protein
LLGYIGLAIRIVQIKKASLSWYPPGQAYPLLLDNRSNKRDSRIKGA